MRPFDFAVALLILGVPVGLIMKQPDLGTSLLVLAAGLAGIEGKMALEPEMKGDMYTTKGIREIPTNLRDAAAKLNGSAMLRAAFGDDVVEHYHHAAQWEISETDRVVTDFELQRLLERA